MMRKQGHVSDNSEIGMVEIDVLPFLDVLVLLQPAVVHFEVDEVADRCAQNSNHQQNTWDIIIDSWLEVAGEAKTE